MKMISSTSITSTKGVTLISLITAALPRPIRDGGAARRHRPISSHLHPSDQASSWRDRMVANSSAKAS